MKIKTYISVVPLNIFVVQKSGRFSQEKVADKKNATQSSDWLQMLGEFLTELSHEDVFRRLTTWNTYIYYRRDLGNSSYPKVEKFTILRPRRVTGERRRKGGETNYILFGRVKCLKTRSYCKPPALRNRCSGWIPGPRTFLENIQPASGIHSTPTRKEQDNSQSLGNEQKHNFTNTVFSTSMRQTSFVFFFQKK